MSTLERLPGVGSLIVRRVNVERRGYKEISEELKAMYPGIRGLSVRSVRRYCCMYNIHATSMLSSSNLDRVVSSSVAKVC